LTTTARRRRAPHSVRFSLAQAGASGKLTPRFALALALAGYYRAFVRCGDRGLVTLPGP
jgi:hypothetical protein